MKSIKQLEVGRFLKFKNTLQTHTMENHLVCNVCLKPEFENAIRKAEIAYSEKQKDFLHEFANSALLTDSHTAKNLLHSFE